MDIVKTVKITTNNQISVMELPSWSLKDRAQAIGADCIEIVRTQRMYDFFEDMVVMIVDDSGLKENRTVNLVASFFYGVDQHGGVIAGDILLGVQRGSDVLPPDYAEELLQLLLLRFPMLQVVTDFI